MNRAERVQLDSFAMIPLADFCGDIRPNELLKVQHLESDNIFHTLNIIGSLLGMVSNEYLLPLLRMDPFSTVIMEAKKMYSGEELYRVLFYVLTRLLLNNGNLLNGRKVSFQGEMPQKFMSFRQTTANQWFEKYVDLKLSTVWNVLTKLGIEDAHAHLLASTAYALYNSQPNEFNISNCSNLDEAIKYILTSWLTRRDGSSLQKFNQKGEILFKDL